MNIISIKFQIVLLIAGIIYLGWWIPKVIQTPDAFSIISGLPPALLVFVCIAIIEQQKRLKKINNA